MHTTRRIAPDGATRLLNGKTLAWMLLAIGELILISYLFDFAPRIPDRENPIFYVSFLVRSIAVALPVFILLNWSKRAEISAQWATLEAQHRPLRALALNILLFAATAAFAVAITSDADREGAQPWHLLPLFGALVAAMSLSLVSVAVPLRGLAAFLRAWRSQMMVACAAATVIALAAEAARYLWANMAAGTLALSAAILRLYEKDVLVDTVEHGIRVGDFGAQIWPTCSGYEGLVLVASFLTLYIWVFREQLRYPHVFLLYPIGLGAIWILNSARIALLVSIGAHWSPEMAVKGFHSQAGWIAFLLVALGLIALTGPLGLTTRARRPATSAGKAASSDVGADGVAGERYVSTVAHLAPFVAMMLGSIAMSTAAPHEHPVYIVKVLLIGLALWMCSRSYGAWFAMPSPIAISSGALVGIAWIATHPPSDGLALQQWLTTLGPGLAFVWLAARAAGSVILVPVAEELAFRGFLYRRLIGRDFANVSPHAFSWMAWIVSSAAFGVLHDRWLAASLAGLVFALVMCRTGKLRDAIVSHATANAVIFVWALAWRDWSLL